MLHHALNKKIGGQKSLMPDEGNELLGCRQKGDKPDQAGEAEQDKAREPVIVPRPF